MRIPLMLPLWQRDYSIIACSKCKAAWLTRRVFGTFVLESPRAVLSYAAANWRASRDVLHEKEKTERLVKQRLPSVSTGRPQLLRTNIRHAVAAYGLMVTVQSEVRRSAVRNAVRKTARVISAALCAPPNDRPVPAAAARPPSPPYQPFRGMARGMPPECRRKKRPAVTSDVKSTGSWCFPTSSG